MAEKFVRMVKEGQEPIEVYPSVVKNHEELGWQVADKAPAPAEAEAQTSAPGKAAGKRASTRTASKE